jgi:hypothetical protein
MIICVSNYQIAFVIAGQARRIDELHVTMAARRRADRVQ